MPAAATVQMRPKGPKRSPNAMPKITNRMATHIARIEAARLGRIRTWVCGMIGSVLLGLLFLGALPAGGGHAVGRHDRHHRHGGAVRARTLEDAVVPRAILGAHAEEQLVDVAAQ